MITTKKNCKTLAIALAFTMTAGFQAVQAEAACWQAPGIHQRSEMLPPPDQQEQPQRPGKPDRPDKHEHQDEHQDEHEDQPDFQGDHDHQDRPDFQGDHDQNRPDFHGDHDQDEHGPADDRQAPPDRPDHPDDQD